MFGQNKPAFSTGTFSQTGGFGTTAPFGGGTNTSTFGTKTTGSTAFGTPGGFGAQPAASTGLFGNTATATPAGGMFGPTANTSFGQTQNTGFGGFGTQTSQAGGLFGSTANTSNVFGTATTSSAFGSKTPSAAGFGATNQASGGLFGTTNPTGTSLFGGTGATATTGGGLFGTTSKPAGAFGAGVNGTTVKFNPPAGTDTVLKGGNSQSINTRHQCITAMKEYEAKSLEELRAEDYVANRKGPQAGSTATGGLFGPTQNIVQPNTGFTGFGQNKTTGFGGFGTNTATGGLFGQQQTPQQSNTSLFGNTANKPLFGTTTTATSTGFGAFGTPATTQATAGLFGQTQQKGPFGAVTTQQSGGLFGQTQTSTAGFGTTAGFGGFGATAQPAQSTGVFNKPAFGTPTTSSTVLGFGQPATGGLFNKPATANTGFNFGQTTNTGFGQQTGGLFGAKTGGFGTASNTLSSASTFGVGLGTGIGTGSSLFSGQQKPTLGLGSTFGANTGLGSFGTNTLGTGLGLVAGATAGLGSSTDTAAIAAQQAQIQQQLLALANSPYGDSPLFRNLKQEESKRDEALKPTNPAAQKAALTAATQYKVNSRPTAKIKPKPLQSLNGKSQLFEGLEEEDSSFGNDTFVPRKSIKKLVIKSGQRSIHNSSLHNTSLNTSIISPQKSRLMEEDELVAPSPIMPPANGISNRPSPDAESPTLNGDAEVIIGGKSINSSIEQTPVRGPYGRGVLDDTITALVGYNRSDQDSRHDSTEEDVEGEPEVPHPAGIKLTRTGYYTLPELSSLGELVDENDDCWVQGFVVGRTGYGNVFFPGLTNVAGLDLDEIVHFRRKEITVYPDDDNRPPNGKGLNKKAQVTLDCVWPNDKTTHMPIQCPERLKALNYQAKIEQATARFGATFIDYRPESGSWVFQVRHFSKYGLVDDESDDEIQVIEKDPKKFKVLEDKNKQAPTIQITKILVDGNDSHREAESTTAPPAASFEPLRQETFTGEMGDIMAEQMPDYYDITDDGEMSEQAGENSSASHRMAARLGVSARDVQVMKASFFGDEDMETDHSPRVLPGTRGLGGSLLGSAQSSPLIHQHQNDMFTKQSPSLATAPSVRPVATQKSTLQHNFLYDRVQRQPKVVPQPTMKPFHQPCPDHIVLPSGLTDMDRPQRLVGARIPRPVPALEDSYLNNKHHMMMDAGLFRGRVCRVGWGPGMTLFHCGNPISNDIDDISDKPSVMPQLIGSTKRRLDESPYSVIVEKINITGYSTQADPILKNMLEKTLEIQLKHCEMRTETGSPVFVPNPGVASLHRCAEQAAEDEERIANHPYASTVCHTRMVWDLCVALWGKLNHFMTENDMDTSSHEYHMVRREAFSCWLSSTASRKIKREINDAKIKGESHLPAVLSYMSGRQISEACLLAQTSGDHRLAMLLAQASGSSMSRKMLARQLAIWHEHKTDSLMEEERLRLYALLAGTMVWPASHIEVNVCQKLDWKRCLAIHLWYLCTPTSKVSDALKEYECAFSGTSELGTYASLPLPPYLEDNVDKLYMTDETQDEQYVVRDMCYHLIKLYSEKSHRLERILSPTTSTPNHLDLTLSWHMLQVLQALEYHHLSNYAAASVTSGFAAQLEALGLWHWAVFVLLHLQDSQTRQHAVQELLGRHVRLSRDADYIDREHFIQERLQVPSSWLHSAKAQRACIEGRFTEEAWHLLKSSHWNKAHTVLLKHVAADAIINEKYSYLKRYLREMAPTENSSAIQDWAIGGKVFHDYISMVETLDDIKQGDLNAYELERLQPEVTSLCNRIGHLPCYTAKDRLCQSEMAKRTANLLRMLQIVQQSHGGKLGLSAFVLAPPIAKLPLPEDYALQELRDLTRAHMIEMTS